MELLRRQSLYLNRRRRRLDYSEVDGTLARRYVPISEGSTINPLEPRLGKYLGRIHDEQVYARYLCSTA